jgi:hypothetical protein
MRSTLRLLPLVVAAVFAASGNSGGAHARAGGGQFDPQLANRCVALASALNGRYVAAAGDGYRADSPTRAGAVAFYMKPTGLGTYLLYDEGGKLLSLGDPGVGGLARAQVPGKRRQWALDHVSAERFRLVSTSRFPLIRRASSATRGS